MKATRAEIEMIAIALYESYVRSKGGGRIAWGQLPVEVRDLWRKDAKTMLVEQLS